MSVNKAFANSRIFAAVSAIADISRDHHRAEGLWFMENLIFGRLSKSKTKLAE